MRAVLNFHVDIFFGALHKTVGRIVILPLTTLIGYSIEKELCPIRLLKIT